MVVALSVEDISAVGLGFDIAGACLLARGVLLSPAQIGRSATYSGLASAGAVTLRDRVDAEVGVSLLVLGFVLQAIGYVAQEAGMAAGPDGADAAVLFAVITAVSVAAGFATYRLLAPLRMKRVALAAALSHSAPDEPDGKWLMYWGGAIGETAHPGETQGAYAMRVWGVSGVSDSEES